ncbi:hypothetical protein BDQ17DRAFT_1511633 [Cyathus striatus]|nr:hypothetical protein BDQ17DRAFT_1511633 [Cyathus striatus]
MHGDKWVHTHVPVIWYILCTTLEWHITYYLSAILWCEGWPQLSSIAVLLNCSWQLCIWWTSFAHSFGLKTSFAHAFGLKEQPLLNSLFHIVVGSCELGFPLKLYHKDWLTWVIKTLYMPKINKWKKSPMHPGSHIVHAAVGSAAGGGKLFLFKVLELFNFVLQLLEQCLHPTQTSKQMAQNSQ